MRKILVIILNFLKGIIRFIAFLFFFLGAVLLHKATNEKGKEKKITVRKARRIRFFTGIKKILGRHLWLADLIGFKNEIIETNRILNDGMQLCNNGTTQRAL